MKSEIGNIVSLLFRDKYPQKANDRLDKKERMKLQRELPVLINSKSDPIILNEEKPINYPPRFEDEFKLDGNLSSSWLVWLQRAMWTIDYRKEKNQFILSEPILRQ